MTREEKENLLREAVDILIKLDNHLMTSRDNAEFSAWVEDLMDNSYCEEQGKCPFYKGKCPFYKAESSSEKPNKWIPVSERLPELGEAVLTYHEDDEEYQINWVTDDETVEWFHENPTAWMYLPEPYKQEVEE